MRNGHKYGAVATIMDGIRFASKAEAQRYAELKLLEKAGEIRCLRVQPAFPLYVQTNVVADDPIKIGTYRGDFAYETSHGAVVVEDVKGVRTPLYQWKKRHVESQYGITITEVMRGRRQAQRRQRTR